MTNKLDAHLATGFRSQYIERKDSFEEGVPAAETKSKNVFQRLGSFLANTANKTNVGAFARTFTAEKAAAQATFTATRVTDSEFNCNITKVIDQLNEVLEKAHQSTTSFNSRSSTKPSEGDSFSSSNSSFTLVESEQNIQSEDESETAPLLPKKCVDDFRKLDGETSNSLKNLQEDLKKIIEASPITKNKGEINQVIDELGNIHRAKKAINQSAKNAINQIISLVKENKEPMPSRVAGATNAFFTGFGKAIAKDYTVGESNETAPEDSFGSSFKKVYTKIFNSPGKLKEAVLGDKVNISEAIGNKLADEKTLIITKIALFIFAAIPVQAVRVAFALSRRVVAAFLTIIALPAIAIAHSYSKKQTERANALASLEERNQIEQTSLQNLAPKILYEQREKSFKARHQSNFDPDLAKMIEDLTALNASLSKPRTDSYIEETDATDLDEEYTLTFNPNYVITELDPFVAISEQEINEAISKLPKSKDPNSSIQVTENGSTLDVRSVERSTELLSAHFSDRVLAE
ncbi:MAG: hypothetical protein ACOYK9_05775 [Chlamydiia bacterium]